MIYLALYLFEMLLAGISVWSAVTFFSVGCYPLGFGASATGVLCLALEAYWLKKWLARND